LAKSIFRSESQNVLKPNWGTAVIATTVLTLKGK
jgi:hypothetical protein